MKKFYFVGGLKSGQAEEFFRRLAEVGGAPSGWRIYPHAANDGMALQIVEAEFQEEILSHLRKFRDIYEHSEHSEIIEPRESTRASESALAKESPQGIS